MADRKYVYHSETKTLCPHCMKVIQGKIIIEDGKVFIKKYCDEHGEMKHLLEENAEFYLNQIKYQKPGTISKTQTCFKNGCPYDCGLCTEHEQHTCIGLIEVTNKCNMNCPVCYANSGKGTFLSMKNIEEMMDFFQDSEFGNGEILQLSGGEPTLHPQILDIIKLARAKDFKYTMLNTNGIRIAVDESFAKSLGDFHGKFEVYLQWDGFKAGTFEHLRGKDYSKMKLQALRNLQKYHVPITLVSTIEEGVNDSEIGDIVRFGLAQDYIRGINLQPLSLVGRYPEAKESKRITMTGILERIEKQTKGNILVDDFLPLPCHPERVAFTYLYKLDGKYVPITRDKKTDQYVPFIKNTFSFAPEDFVKEAGRSLAVSPIACSGKCFNLIKDLRPLIPKKYFTLPKKERDKHINENTFRISVTSFIDPYNFDIQSMRKECVHIITPDLKKIPFSSFNMIYREKYMKEEI